MTDPSDPKLAHLDGLNLSRAWMLDGIVSSEPAEDPRVGSLRRAARRHREAGLEAVTGEHYEGGHWLGSFATYLVTSRGLAARGESPAAFDRRCIPQGLRWASRSAGSHTAGIFPRRALYWPSAASITTRVSVRRGTFTTDC